MFTVAILSCITSILVVGYWAAVFAGFFPVKDLVPGYRDWFMAFPIADAWIALWAFLTSFALYHRQQERARRFALLAGSGLVFLGLYAMTYGAVTGLIYRQTFDQAAEIAIKLYCLSAGGYLVLWGLRRQVSRSEVGGRAEYAPPGLPR